MKVKIYWLDSFKEIAVANLVNDAGIHIRKYDVSPDSVKEFIEEYFEYRTRPVQPHPYWSRDSHIATLSYYLKQIDEALAHPDDAVKLANVKAIMLDYNTPKAVA